MTTNGPDPATVHPMAGFPQACLVRNTVTGPNVEIGEYTCAITGADVEALERAASG